MSKEPRKTYLSEETIEVIDSVKQNSRERAEMYDMSDSEVIRELVNHAIEHLDENPAVEELVDAIDLDMWQNQQRHEKRRKKAKYADMAGGWRGRVRSYLNKRLAGPEPHPPERVEDLAESYLGDIRDWEKDVDTLERNEEKIEEHEEWLEGMIEEYRDAYAAKMTLPDEAFENHDDVETGADLRRLRDSFEEVLTTIAELAGSDAYDVDGMYRRLAGDYAVEEDTIELVVEKLTGDDVDARRALKDGDGILAAVDRQALTAWGGDPDALPDGVDVEADGDDGDDDGGDPQVTDAEGDSVEELDALPADAIVRKGGRAEADVVDVEDGTETETEAVETAAAGDAESGREETAEAEVADGGLTAEDLTTEALIETAVDMIEAGEGEDAIVHELRRDAPSETAVECAIEVARDRAGTAGSEGGDDAPPVLTDGGEDRD